MFVHGNNLEQKETHQTKYNDKESKQFLSEIRVKYDQWKYANEALAISQNNEFTNFANQIIVESKKCK